MTYKIEKRTEQAIKNGYSAYYVIELRFGREVVHGECETIAEAEDMVAQLEREEHAYNRGPFGN